MMKSQNIDPMKARNIAIYYYKDKGMELMDNDEVHFAGGLAGYHRGVVMDPDTGKYKVNFKPSKNMLKSTIDRKFKD